MKSIFTKLSTLSVLFLPCLAFAESNIFQAGTLLNLMNGVYIGSTSFSELAKKGDMGLGTANGLSGEMVEMDSIFYLADSNGNTTKAPLSTKTPFAMVTHFVPQQRFDLHNINNADQLEAEIDQHLPSKNLFYVIRVDGKFSFVKARSVMPTKKPYLPLNQVIKTNQSIFYFKDLDGSLVIFRSPSFSSPLTVPGYHLHFISADHKKAGHVFDL